MRLTRSLSVRAKAAAKARRRIVLEEFPISKVAIDFDYLIGCDGMSMSRWRRHLVGLGLFTVGILVYSR